MWLDAIDVEEEGMGSYGISSSSQGSTLKSPVRSKNGESKLSLKKKRNGGTKRQKKNITLSRRKRARQINHSSTDKSTDITTCSNGNNNNNNNNDNTLQSSFIQEGKEIETKLDDERVDEGSIRTKESIIPIPPFTPLHEDEEEDDDDNSIKVDAVVKNDVDLKSEQHRQDSETENFDQNLKQKTNHKNWKRHDSSSNKDSQKQVQSKNTSPLMLHKPNTSSLMAIPSFSPQHIEQQIVIKNTITTHQHETETSANNPLSKNYQSPQKKKSNSKDLNNEELSNTINHHDKKSQYFQSKQNETCPLNRSGKENEYRRESISKKSMNKNSRSMMDVSDSDDDDDWLVPSPAFSKRKSINRKENTVFQKQQTKKKSKTEPNCIIIDLEDKYDNDNNNNMIQNNDSKKNSRKQITTRESSTPQKPTGGDSIQFSCNESITHTEKDSRNDKQSLKSTKNVPKKVEDKPIVTNVEQGILPLTDDENFYISRAKKLSEKERHLDQVHNTLLKTSKERLHKASHKVGNLKKTKGMNKGQKGKKLCVICSTCTCAKGSTLHELEQRTIDESKSPLQHLARSDKEVERALISRLSRLEKSAAWYDHLCYKVNRELKKHRSKALKKLLEHNNVKDKPIFLEDVAIGDDFVMKHGIAPSIPSALAHTARNKLFSFRKKRQPTLTQMLGKEPNSGDESLDKFEPEDDGNRESNSEVESSTGERKHANEDIIDLMDESHENDETCDDKSSSENYLIEDDTFENQMAEFYDATYRKDNRIDELGFHTETGNIMWDLSKSSEIPNISHIRVAQLSSTTDRTVSSTFDDKKRSKVNNETSSSYKTDQFTNIMQSFDFTQSNDQVDGMSHLLELFGGVDNSTEPVTFVDANEDVSIVSDSKDKEDIPNFSQLSQQGQVIAQEIERNVNSEPEKRHLIEKMCPNWKENISFALLQKNSIELNNALENLKEERERMVRVMQKITNAYEQRNFVLDFYQSALEQSIIRSSTTEDNSCSVTAGKDETIRKESEKSTTADLSGCLEKKNYQDTNKCVDSTIKRSLFTIDESDSEDSFSSASQNHSSATGNLVISDLNSEKMPPHEDKNSGDNMMKYDDSEQMNVDLSSLETTKLKLLMEKYGLKAQSRRRMINILTEVFDAIQKDSFDTEETRPTQSQKSVQSRDGMSEPPTVTKKRKQKPKDIEELHRMCREALDRDTSLKLRILSHESIEFSEIEQTILNTGIHISKKKLSEWLDKNKIRYADPWRQRK